MVCAQERVSGRHDDAAKTERSSLESAVPLRHIRRSKLLQRALSMLRFEVSLPAIPDHRHPCAAAPTGNRERSNRALPKARLVWTEDFVLREGRFVVGLDLRRGVLVPLQRDVAPHSCSSMHAARTCECAARTRNFTICGNSPSRVGSIGPTAGTRF